MRNLLEYIVLKYLVVPKVPEVMPGKKHLACIGDSITFGAGVGGKKEETWEYYLNRILGKDIQVLNYGISGRTLQMEGDYPYGKEKFYRFSHAIQADCYLIMLGTNDAKFNNWNEKRYAEQVAEFTESYLKLPNHPHVVLMTPPQCYPDSKTGKTGYNINEKYIDGPVVEIIGETAKKLQIPVIDLHTFTQNHGEWFEDGVHPNKDGNQAIGAYIAQELKKMKIPSYDVIP